MKTYTDIDRWIESSIKNAFFFRNEATLRELVSIPREMSQAVSVLKGALLEHEKNPSFFTRAEYLEWRRVWRKVYAKLSYESRMSKRNRKSSDPGLSDSCRWANISNSTWLKTYGRKMMELRALSKELARTARELKIKVDSQAEMV